MLVHGVFGSGKSKLLVAVLWMLQRLLPATRVDGGAGRPGRTPRVLMAALTNVAVDNVIGALLRENDEEEGGGGGGGGGGVAAGSVLRVGSLRRIAPAVLPHSTHGRLSDDDEKSARRELSQELQGASGAERLALRAALAGLDSGRLRARTYRRVGERRRRDVRGVQPARDGRTTIRPAATRRVQPAHRAAALALAEDAVRPPLAVGAEAAPAHPPRAAPRRRRRRRRRRRWQRRRAAAAGRASSSLCSSAWPTAACAR